MAAQHGENYNIREVSEATISTFSKIKQKYTRSRKALSSAILDNTSPGYEWLLLGWVAEERYMASGRIYKYYYDPGANFYKSRAEVIATWEANNTILIEDDD